ncbi:MAG: hypothetical protein PHN82_08485 [bacterium]|nr:hypothetical protein [bacterium]
MRIIRPFIRAFAWLLPLAAIVLIVEYTRRTYPEWPDLLRTALYGEREPEGDTRAISAFDDELDLERWYRMGARLVLRGKWGVATFGEGKGQPGFRLTDYRAGPGGVRDWSGYCRLLWEIRSPQATDQPLDLIVKDAGNKRFQRSFPIPAGGPRTVALDLRELNPVLDLERVVEVHFFMTAPKAETVVHIRGLRLDREGCEPGEVIGEPFVVFEGLEAPASAALGEAVEISALLSVAARQEIPYHVFLHLYPESERDEAVPARRKGYIHVERVPHVPVTEWPPDAPQEVGPFSVYFPRTNPAGRYLIRLGLFNPSSGGEGPRNVAYRGAYDYGGSFPKCRYTDPAIDDFVVGSIDVRAAAEE